MTRPRNKIPQYISLDVLELDLIQNKFSTDAEFGAWMRKAIRDLRLGCQGADVDPFIKSQYEIAFNRMTQRQRINADAYQAKHTHAAGLHTAAHNTATAGAESGNTSENITTSVSNSASSPESSTPAVVLLPLENPKRAYGENKKVLLTNEEGAKLREVYGDDLELAIEILDGYIVNNSRKASKYKSHYSVLKKSGWVWDKVQEKRKATAQLKKAESLPKSFAEIERDRAGNLAESVMIATGVM